MADNARRSLEGIKARAAGLGQVPEGPRLKRWAEAQIQKFKRRYLSAGPESARALRKLLSRLK